MATSTPATETPATPKVRTPNQIVLTDQYAVSFHRDVTVRPDLEAVLIKWAAQNGLDVHTEARRTRTPKPGAKVRTNAPAYHPITVVPHGWTKPVAAAPRVNVVSEIAKLDPKMSVADALAALRAAGIIS